MNPPITRRQYVELRARLETLEQEQAAHRKVLDETEPNNTSAWTYVSGKLAGVAAAINVLEGYFYSELPPVYKPGTYDTDHCPRWQNETANFLSDPITVASGCGDEFLPRLRTTHRERCGLCGTGTETNPVMLNSFALGEGELQEVSIDEAVQRG